MTVFGLDVSHYQSGLNLATMKEQGYAFCMAKVTEGGSYVDPSYVTFRDAARKEEVLFAAYHFLRSDVDPGVQAVHCVSNLGDKTIPIMMDIESEGSSSPGYSTIVNFMSAVKKAGGRVSMAYLPRWYWEGRLARVSLLGMTPIVASDYVSGHNYASKLYPGGQSSLWNQYGGVVPTIAQFSSNGIFSGYGGTVDVNAYRGSLEMLKTENLFKDYEGAPALKQHTWESLNGFTLPDIHLGDNDAEFAGDHGVIRLQTMLGITKDGIYGPATAAAVKARFQEDDGNSVGLHQWAQLYGFGS